MDVMGLPLEPVVEIVPFHHLARKCSLDAPFFERQCQSLVECLCRLGRVGWRGGNRELPQLLECPDRPGEHQHAITFIDRKSTRLNSSHTVISYAVFCLKKKNNREPVIRHCV